MIPLAFPEFVAMVKKVPFKDWLAMAMGASMAFLVFYSLNQHEIAREATVDKLNIAAQLDTTRAVLATKDSQVVFWKKLAVQRSIERDSVDRKLASVTKVKAQVVATLPTVKDSAVGESEIGTEADSSDVFAKFHSYHEPFALDAVVSIPRFETDTSKLKPRMMYVITPDPVVLEPRVACSSSTDHGIHQAMLYLGAPKWAKIHVDTLTQTVDVCNPASPHVNIPRVTQVLTDVKWLGTGLLIGVGVVHFVFKGK